MAKIAVTMIARDEESTLRACLESMAPHADELVFVDTGSTDRTVEIAREFTDKVFHFDWINDFAAARQFALEQVSDDVDWIVWADADDILQGADRWRSLIERAPAHVQGYVFPYHYQIDPKTGAVTTKLYRERLLRGPASRWEWKGSVHEVIALRDGSTPHLLVSEECVYLHNRPEQKHVPDRNLKIIEEYLKTCETTGAVPDARMVSYLGSELMAHGRWAEAIPAFYRYIGMSQWDEEKYQAHHKLADCYRQLGLHNEAIQTELRALAVRDDWADGYYGIAESYYHLKQWDKVVKWTERGDEVGPPSTLLITHPLDYTFLPKVFVSVALFHLGRIEDALAALDDALAVVPDDPKLMHNRTIFSENLRNKKIVEAAITLSSELILHDEALLAWDILARVPHTLRFDARIVDARAKLRRAMPQVWDDRYTAVLDAAPTALDVDVTQRPAYASLLKDIETKWGADAALTILDVGCGDGSVAVDLARRGHTVVALDPNPIMVQAAQARAEHFKVSERLSFVQGTTDALMQSGDFDFDVAIAFDVLDQVAEVQPVLTDMFVRTKLDGLIAVSSPDGVHDRAAVEALGLDVPRGRVRVLPRHELTDYIYGLGFGRIRTNVVGSDRFGYLSFDNWKLEARDITIWCPFGYEPWSPDSLNSGIGGSEEAVIHMAQGLADAGNRVTVYGGAEGAWGGVLYHQYGHFDPYREREVVVIWRTPAPLDFNLNSEQVYVWMHDVPNPPEFTPERLAKVDKVWVLSEWHRKCLPNVPDEKIEVIRNGVNPPAATTSGDRDKLKVVWGSSPDRGIDKLLAVWPEVAAAVPGATLHCYYGFDMYDKMGRPPAFKNQVMAAVEQNKDTVVWHGRVGQSELWDAFSTAGVWAYPTYFDEISCITAMRAQMAGAWPVVVPQAALAETVRYGTKVDHDINTDEGLQAFRDALIHELKNPISDEDRQTMVTDASEFYSWAKVTGLWLDRFEADRG